MEQAAPDPGVHGDAVEPGTAFTSTSEDNIDGNRTAPSGNLGEEITAPREGPGIEVAAIHNDAAAIISDDGEAFSNIIREEAEVHSAVKNMTLLEIAAAARVSQTIQNDDQESQYTSGNVQAPAILRQVEYYFSDKNLAHDNFLTSKMKDQKNLPIPVDLVRSFRKMRAFEPRSAVIAAIRESEHLEIVQHKGRDCIQRKEPFVKESERDGVIKKPKVKPTGFEEYWTDPPVTPAQFAEEQDLYDPTRIFADRIETALQIFRSKRKFHARVANTYSKWMKYGGVDTGQKPFGGGAGLQNYEDKQERIKYTSTEFVDPDKFDLGDDYQWNVDFEGVAKGFLFFSDKLMRENNRSSVLMRTIRPEGTEQMHECISILRNLYNYLLHHNVCPEYTDSINAARRICTLAETELPMTSQALLLLPGSFNVACSTLFGGYNAQFLTDDREDGWGGTAVGRAGMNTKEARQVLAMGLAAYGPNELFAAADADQDENNPAAGSAKRHLEQSIVHTEKDVGLEVTAIEYADDDVRALHSNVDFGDNEKDGAEALFGVLGRLHCKAWDAPSFETFDRPAHYKPPARPEEYVFLVEEDALDACFVGMKLETSVHTLSGGMKLFDAVTAAHCSFYTALENELLLKKTKEVRYYTREEELARVKD